jgi:hypothetical protein
MHTETKHYLTDFRYEFMINQNYIDVLRALVSADHFVGAVMVKTQKSQYLDSFIRDPCPL